MNFECDTDHVEKELLSTNVRFLGEKRATFFSFCLTIDMLWYMIIKIVFGTLELRFRGGHACVTRDVLERWFF